MNTVHSTVGIVMVAPRITAFSGYKRTNEQDIVDGGGKMPDTDILTKGGKHIFPQENLSPFATLRKTVIREISKFGVQAFGGSSIFAINENDLPEAEKIMAAGEIEFKKLLAELDMNYDAWLDAFILSNPKGSDIIRRSALTKEDALSRFSYSYESFRPTPVGQNGSIESMAQNLSNRLYIEVAQFAYELWDKSFTILDRTTGNRSRRQVGQKVLKPFKTTNAKLRKLSFLNPSIDGAIAIVEGVLAKVHPTGYIEDTPSNLAETRLYALVMLMQNAINFANAAEAVVNGADPDDVLNYKPNPVQVTLPDEIGAVIADSMLTTIQENSKSVVVAAPIALPASVVQHEEDPETMFF